MPFFRRCRGCPRRFTGAELGDGSQGLVPGDMGEFHETPRRKAGVAAGPGAPSSLSVPARLRRSWHVWAESRAWEVMGAATGAAALVALAFILLWLTEGL